MALRETQRTLGPTPAADDAAQETVLRACEEIASELACSLGTIKVRLHRARHKLGDAPTR